MRPASDTFHDAVRESHRLATRATINDTEVSVIDGTVTLDSTAAIRGRCDVTIADPSLVPNSPTALLAPYGNEIQLARGAIYPDGTSELVTLGVFGIQSVEVNDTPAGMEMRLTGLDRAARVVNARFEQPYQINAGTNYADAILTTLQGAWDLPNRFTSTDLTTPQLIAQEGEDRWAFCQQMAAAISMSLYFDGDGVCVLAPTTQPETIEMLIEGDHGVLLETNRNWTREGTYNRVIATGENTGEDMPVRGIATDEDPASPTYYYGPFGRVPVFYASPFITTSAQAAAAAADRLQSELGTTEQVNFGSLVLPYLEPGDVLQITRLRAGINETHVLTSVTVPLAATASMTGQTRAQRIAVSTEGGGIDPAAWHTFGIVDLSDGVTITAQDDTDFSGAWLIATFPTGPSLQITVKLDPPTDDNKTNSYLHVHDARTESPPVAFGFFRFVLDMVNDDLACDYDAYQDDHYHEVERIPYDPANHAWLRFTIASNTLHYEASPDGSAWTEVASTPWPDDAAHTTPEGIIELNTASDIPSGPYDSVIRWAYLNINGTVILDAR